MVYLILFDSLLHPIVHASTLMKIGHEPIPPYPSTTVFGSPVYALPNVFDYMWHVKTEDGLWEGCYLGYCAQLLSCFVTRLAALVTFEVTATEDDDITTEAYLEMSDSDRHALFLRAAGRTVVAQMVATVASHPLHVVALRMMAQFVGKETKYRGVFSGLHEVCADAGFLGLFVGLSPRLIGDVSTLVCAAAMTHLLNTYIIDDPDLRLVWGVMYWLSSKLFWPFQVVSSTMAVNNCGLAAGLPPRAQVYKSWHHCWRHLSEGRQLFRGDRYFWRYAPPGLVAQSAKLGK